MNHKKNIELLGVPLFIGSFNDVLKSMEISIRQNQKRNYISITNTESMYHALKDPKHFNYIKNSNYSLCDGIGVVICGRFWKIKIPRLNGPVLMLKACEYGINKGWKHFFYGGNEMVVELLEKNLKKLYPGLIVTGKYTPPFISIARKESNEVIKLIRDSKPDIIWVGLGLLKQERWIMENINELKVPWMVGVGGAFDYHSGVIPWAPKWVQAIGMEWLFRTIIEPSKRIKRYYWSFVFVMSAFLKSITSKK